MSPAHKCSLCYAPDSIFSNVGVLFLVLGGAGCVCDAPSSPHNLAHFAHPSTMVEPSLLTPLPAIQHREHTKSTTDKCPSKRIHQSGDNDDYINRIVASFGQTGPSFPAHYQYDSESSASFLDLPATQSPDDTFTMPTATGNGAGQS
jgi:hypothetical protein